MQVTLEAPSRFGCRRALGWSVRAEFGALSNMIRVSDLFA